MTRSARRGSASTADVDPAERAREIALRLLQHSPRSAAQLREGLVKREVDEQLADHLIERYREVGLIDDTALAAQVARTRHRERGQSRRAVSMELRRKGFEAADIEGALEQIDDESEREAARALAYKRWQRLADLPCEIRSRRIVAMLGRKGYSPGLAFALVRELESADSRDEEFLHEPW